MDVQQGFEVLVAVLGAVSVVLNAAVIACTAMRREAGWGIDGVLLVLIGGSDIASSLMMGVFQASPRTDLWCFASSVAFCGSTLASLLLTAQLGLVRYLVIVRKWKLASRRWAIGGGVLIVVAWHLFTFATLLGQPLRMASRLYCIPAHRHHGSSGARVYLDVTLSMFVFSLVLVVGVYGFIGYHYYRRSRNPRHMLKLVLIVTCYLVAIVPEFGLMLFNHVTDTHRSPLQDAVVVTLLFSTTLINALFVLIWHHETRQKLTDILRIAGILRPLRPKY